MMIAVIGYGFVGKAIAHSHRSDELFVLDPKLDHSASWDQVACCDAVYLCVPSPSNLDGSCNTGILEQVLEQCKQHNIVDVPIISKVTAPPNVYQRLQAEYENLVHCPEFLTAANNIQDYENTKYLVVGGNPVWANKAAIMMTNTLNLLPQKAMITDIASASLYKYMMNCYLATKVSLMNEFHSAANRLGLDWESVTNLSQWDERIGSTHMSVPGPDGSFGWGGMCFPKDTSAFVNFSQQLGIDANLIKCVISANQKHRSV